MGDIGQLQKDRPSAPDPAPRAVDRHQIVRMSQKDVLSLPESDYFVISESAPKW